MLSLTVFHGGFAAGQPVEIPGTVWRWKVPAESVCNYSMLSERCGSSVVFVFEGGYVGQTPTRLIAYSDFAG